MRELIPGLVDVLRAAVLLAKNHHEKAAQFLVGIARDERPSVDPRCPVCFEDWTLSRPLCAHCGFEGVDVNRATVLADLLARESLSPHDVWHHCLLESLRQSEFRQVMARLAPVPKKGTVRR